MTEQDVKQIIAKDMADMNNAPYPEPMPEWILDNFDEIIMNTPQSTFPYFSKTVRSIFGKRHNELTFYEGGFVLNLYNQATPKIVAPDIETFLRRKAITEELIGRYNGILKREEDKLTKKEQVLMRGLRSHPKIVTI